MSSLNNLIEIKPSWILTTEGRWLRNGIVLWDKETKKVEKILSPKEKGQLPVKKSITLEHYALIPGLVNSHTHLELSAMGGFFKLHEGNYIKWLKALIREKQKLDKGLVRKHFLLSLEESFREGSFIVADVFNNPLEINPSEACERYLLWELIGFNIKEIEELIKPEELEKIRSEKLSLVPHAVYSTSPEIIVKTHRWCRKMKRIFSIHLCETEEEIEFLMDGSGPFRELLEELGKWRKDWPIPRKTPVEYLNELGCLDKETLLVHSIHLTPRDWDIVKEKGAWICLCPRSNHFLGAGRIKAGEIIKRNIPFLVGTDSLASSPDLSVFKEALFLANHFSELDPHRILQAITGLGYKFFRSDPFPFVEEGHRGNLIAVKVSSNAPERGLSEEVISNGAKGAFLWIEKD